MSTTTPTTTTTTTTRDRGDRYGPMEWAQLHKLKKQRGMEGIFIQKINLGEQTGLVEGDRDSNNSVTKNWINKDEVKVGVRVAVAVLLVAVVVVVGRNLTTWAWPSRWAWLSRLLRTRLVRPDQRTCSKRPSAARG